LTFFNFFCLLEEPDLELPLSEPEPEDRELDDDLLELPDEDEPFELDLFDDLFEADASSPDLFTLDLLSTEGGSSPVFTLADIRINLLILQLQ